MPGPLVRIPPAHSGGVIGTAVVAITGGDTVESVAGGTGILSNVVGGYGFIGGTLSVAFPVAQPDAFYIPACVVESGAATMIKLVDSSVQTTGFSFEFHDKNGSLMTTEVSKIRLTISRLSQ